MGVPSDIKDAEKKEHHIVIDALRWVAVLPAAIGAYLGIQLLVIISNSFSGLPEIVVNIFCQLLNSWVAPGAFVLFGALTAPFHRFITGVVLTVLYSLATGALLALRLTSEQEFSTPLWWTVASLIIGLVACIWACVHLHHEDE
jgi:hypothetical protein